MPRRQPDRWVFIEFEYEYVNGKKAGTAMARIHEREFRADTVVEDLIKSDWRGTGKPDIIVKKWTQK